MTAVLINLKGQIVATQRRSDLIIASGIHLAKYVVRWFRTAEAGQRRAKQCAWSRGGNFRNRGFDRGRVCTTTVFPDKNFLLRKQIEEEVGLWTEVETTRMRAALGEIWTASRQAVHNHNLIYFEVNENLTEFGCGW